MDALTRSAAEGMAVLVVSSELEEVVAISHRVIVLAGGRLVATLAERDDLTVARILEEAFDVGVAR